MHHLKTNAPMIKKIKEKTEKTKTRDPIFKTFYSKNNRPFRLSGITENDAIIYWLDTKVFETFDYKKIEGYLN